MDMNTNNAGSDKEQELLLRYKNTHKQDILGELYNPYHFTDTNHIRVLAQYVDQGAAK